MLRHQVSVGPTPIVHKITERRISRGFPRKFRLGLAVTSLVAILASVSAVPSAAQFSHPGALVSQSELDVARARVANGEQPWAGAFATMKNRPEASLSYQPAPVPDVWQDGYGANDVGGWRMMQDARAAYLHALIWAVQGDPAYAQKSMQIVDAWSSTLQSIGGVNAKLIGAAALIGFENAAELLAHTNTGWSTSSKNDLRDMLLTIGYPLIKDFQPGYNGNWDSIITHAMIDMGVYLDDQAIFDRAVNYYKFGSGNGSLPNYVYSDGTTQETTRDCEHETMGISGLIGTAQTASHQGVDLFGYLDNRLYIGVEGVASRAYDCGPMPTPYPCWEMAYTYYHDIQGMPMPNTELVRSKPGVLPENYGLMTGIGYGTLTANADLAPTPVEPNPTAASFHLLPAVPNPFNPRTTLHFDVPVSSRVQIRIYDVAGRLVRNLVNSEFEPGPHSVMWNARTDDGHSIASGVYLVRMEAGDFVATSRLTLVR